VNKSFIVEGAWRGIFIFIGLFSIFAILFTTSSYNLDRKVLLIFMFFLLYIGIFFNLTSKNIYIFILATTSSLLIYLFFFVDSSYLIKNHEIIFPVIFIGIIHLGYLKYKNIPSESLGV